MYVVRLRGFARVATPAALLCGALVVSSTASAQCERQHVQADMPMADDKFGRTVAVSSGFAAAGLPTDATNGAWSGSVLVYRRNTISGHWDQVQEIIPTDNSTGDVLGEFVAMDGTMLVASARGDDDLGVNAGAAYVFRFNAATNQWVQEAKLHASDGSAGDYFGGSIACDGDVIVVGASRYNSPAREAVYVFRRGSDGLWNEESILDRPADMDRFGLVVGLHQDVVAVTGYVVVGYGTTTFRVYVSRHQPLSLGWSLETILPGTYELSAFGAALAVGDDRVVVGEYVPHSTAGWGAGAQVFGRVGGLWTHEAELKPATATENLWLAPWLAISGNRIAIGDAFDDSTPGQLGTMQVFERAPNGQWTRMSFLAASDGAVADNDFGYSVALDGDRLVVGGPSVEFSQPTGHGPGTVYFFDLDQPDCNLNSLCDDLDISDGTSNDINNNGIPDECEIQGDVNGDGHVDVTDLLLVIISWGLCQPAPAKCPADIAPLFIGDNVVDVNDLLAVVTNWGNSLP